MANAQNESKTIELLKNIFSNLLGQVNYIFNPKGLYRDMILVANGWHYEAVKAALLLFAVLALAIFLNCIGLQKVNIVLGILFNIVVLFLATRPKTLAAVAGISALNPNDKPAMDDAKNGLKMWYNFIGHILLIVSFTLLVTGIVPFKHHPSSLFMIVLTIIILSLMDLAWGFKVKIAKKLIYLFTVTTLVLNFAYLLPREVYIKQIDFYPFSFFDISEPEKEVSDIELQDRANKEKIALRELKKVRDKVKQGTAIENLTGKEKEVWEKYKKERDENTTPTKVGKVINSALTSIRTKTKPPEEIWTTVFARELIGKGYGDTDKRIDAPYFAKDIKYGDKIIIIGEEFEVRNNGWHKYFEKFEEICRNSEYGMMSVKAPQGATLQMEVKRKVKKEV